MRGRERGLAEKAMVPRPYDLPTLSMMLTSGRSPQGCGTTEPTCRNMSLRGPDFDVYRRTVWMK